MIVVAPATTAPISAARPTAPVPKITMLGPAAHPARRRQHGAGAGLDAAPQRTELLERQGRVDHHHVALGGQAVGGERRLAEPARGDLAPDASVTAVEKSPRRPSRLSSQNCSHAYGRDAWQAVHCPHDSKEMTTWSPTATPVTSVPMASTTPAPSCPQMIGGGEIVAAPRGSTSVWHMPAPTMRTTTSSGRGSPSVTCSIEYGWSPARSTAAVISMGCQ